MYRRIMIVVDEDLASQAAAAEGLALARALAADVLFFHLLPAYVMPVTAGDVMPLGVLDAQTHERYALERAERILADAAAMAKAQEVQARGVLARGEESAAAVAQAAVEQHCDLIVVGSHGRNALQRLIHGSLPASLLPLAPVPMLVCKVRADTAR